MSDVETALVVATALGCGLVSGIFFAFSTFVMPALGARPAAEGIAAMQSINVKAIGVGLMTAMFGTAILSIATLVVGVGDAGTSYGGYLLSAPALYLLGVIAVTMLFNVPRNNALAEQDPDSERGARVWADYVVTWTAWNHLRAVTSFAASALLIIGLLQ